MKDSIKYNFVDLGLPSGTLWADRNVGANAHEESGLYFAWGETEGVELRVDGEKVPSITTIPESTKPFTWEDCPFINVDDSGNPTSIIKYNCMSNNEAGEPDDIDTLVETDDAASVNDRNSCHMPTWEDFQELIDNTERTWEQVNGVWGSRFTGSNSNSVFVPAVGGCSDGRVYGVGNGGSLWSASLCEDDASHAWSLLFSSVHCGVGFDRRYGGLPVRGVQKKHVEEFQIGFGNPKDENFTTDYVKCRTMTRGLYLLMDKDGKMNLENEDGNLIFEKWVDRIFETRLFPEVCAQNGMTEGTFGILNNNRINIYYRTFNKDGSSNDNWGGEWIPASNVEKYPPSNAIFNYTACARI